MGLVADLCLRRHVARGCGEALRPTARQIRHTLLTELRPVTLSNCRLERFGGDNDGGYLMCGNLLGNVRSAYSYGIGPRDDLGLSGVRYLQGAGAPGPTASIPDGRSVPTAAPRSTTRTRRN